MGAISTCQTTVCRRLLKAAGIQRRALASAGSLLSKINIRVALVTGQEKVSGSRSPGNSVGPVVRVAAQGKVFRRTSSRAGETSTWPRRRRFSTEHRHFRAAGPNGVETGRYAERESAADRSFDLAYLIYLCSISTRFSAALASREPTLAFLPRT
jgi:hypothetical protein